jgi:hypothetical protein
MIIARNVVLHGGLAGTIDVGDLVVICGRKAVNY